MTELGNGVVEEVDEQLKVEKDDTERGGGGGG